LLTSGEETPAHQAYWVLRDGAALVIIFVTYLAC
jgi:hypothetical protein